MLPWNIQLLRATLFLGEPADGTALWRTIVGEEPAVDENRPREGVRQQGGPLGPASWLQIGVTAERVDLVLMPAIDQEGAPSPAAIIGAAVDVVPQFDSVRAWLPNAGLVVSREAFGLVALLPVPDRDTAYRRLGELVPSVRYDPDSTREVVYQVNRPASSRVLLRTKLNRITKWGATITENVRIMPREKRFITSAEVSHHVRCECDNSTPADSGDALPNDSLGAIYDELRDLALENLERGEIA